MTSSHESPKNDEHDTFIKDPRLAKPAKLEAAGVDPDRWVTSRREELGREIFEVASVVIPIYEWSLNPAHLKKVVKEAVAFAKKVYEAPKKHRPNPFPPGIELKSTTAEAFRELNDSELVLIRLCEDDAWKTHPPWMAKYLRRRAELASQYRRRGIGRESSAGSS